MYLCGSVGKLVKELIDKWWLGVWTQYNFMWTRVWEKGVLSWSFIGWLAGICSPSPSPLGALQTL